MAYGRDDKKKPLGYKLDEGRGQVSPVVMSDTAVPNNGYSSNPNSSTLSPGIGNSQNSLWNEQNVSPGYDLSGRNSRSKLTAEQYAENFERGYRQSQLPGSKEAAEAKRIRMQNSGKSYLGKNSDGTNRTADDFMKQQVQSGQLSNRDYQDYLDMNDQQKLQDPRFRRDTYLKQGKKLDDFSRSQRDQLEEESRGIFNPLGEFAKDMYDNFNNTEAKADLEHSAKYQKEQTDRQRIELENTRYDIEKEKEVERKKVNTKYRRSRLRSRTKPGALDDYFYQQKLGGRG